MNRKPNIRGRGRGFTIVELMVVIGVIVVLTAILVPSLGAADRYARRGQCATNLRGIGAGLNAYLNDSKFRTYPVTTNWYMLAGKRGNAAGYNLPGQDSDQRPLNTYLGIHGAGNEAKIMQCPGDSGGQAVVPEMVPDGLPHPDVMPPDPSWFTWRFQSTSTNNSVYEDVGSSYIDAFTTKTGIEGVFGASQGGAGVSAADLKPPSSKVMLGDAPIYGDNKYFDDPRNRWHGKNPHRREFNLLFADGHVEFFFFDPKEGQGIEDLDDTSDSVNSGHGFW